MVQINKSALPDSQPNDIFAGLPDKTPTGGTSSPDIFAGLPDQPAQTNQPESLGALPDQVSPSAQQPDVADIRRRETQFEQIKAKNADGALMGLKPTDLKTGADKFKASLQENTGEQASIPGAIKETGGALLDTAKNIPGSAWREVKGVASALRHPIQTAKTAGQLGLGILSKAIPGFEANEELADAVGRQFLKEYGGGSKEEILNNITKTMTEDPVKVFGDIMAVVSMAGGAAKMTGKVGKLKGLASAGQKLQKAADVLDPLAIMGQGMSKAKIKVNPFGKRVDTGAINAAAKRGIDLPAASTSKSTAAHKIQTLFVNEKFRKKVEKARAALDDSFATLSSNKPIVSLKETGDTIRKGFETFKEDFRVKSSELYDNVPKGIKKIEVPLDNTRSALKELTEKAKTSLVTRQGQGMFSDFLNKINKQLVETKDAMKATVGADGVISFDTVTELVSQKTVPTTYKQLLQTKKDIGKMLSNHADPISTGLNAELNKLFGSISEDLNQALAKADPEALAAINDANKYYSDEITKINSTVGKQLKNTEASQLTSVLVKKNTPDSLREIKEMIGKDGTEHLQTAFIADAFEQGINPHTGLIEAKRLKAYVKKYGRETIEELLETDQLKKLDELIENADELEMIHGAIKKGEQISSAAGGILSTKLAAFFGSAGVMTFTQPKFIPGLFGFVVADNLVGKFINSKTGQKLFSGGINMDPGFGAPLKAVAPAGEYIRRTRDIKEEQ